MVGGRGIGHLKPVVTHFRGGFFVGGGGSWPSETFGEGGGR